VLQAAVGVDTATHQRPRRAAKSRLHSELLAKRLEELRAGFASGGLLEAGVRALVYVGMARGGADERSFEAIRQLRRNGAQSAQLSLERFKALVREQFFMLMIDRSAAVQAIPALLPEDLGERQAAMALLERIMNAGGTLEGEAAERLEEVRRLFGLAGEVSSQSAAAPRARSGRARLSIAARKEA